MPRALGQQMHRHAEGSTCWLARALWRPVMWACCHRRLTGTYCLACQPFRCAQCTHSSGCSHARMIPPCAAACHKVGREGMPSVSQRHVAAALFTLDCRSIQMSWKTPDGSMPTIWRQTCVQPAAAAARPPSCVAHQAQQQARLPSASPAPMPLPTASSAAGCTRGSSCRHWRAVVLRMRQQRRRLRQCRMCASTRAASSTSFCGSARQTVRAWAGRHEWQSPGFASTWLVG